MKVLLLSAGSVVHTQRWANGLAESGVEVICVSQHPFLETGWSTSVIRVQLPFDRIKGYFLNAPAVRRIFCEKKCDLINVHYATGYGVLASLAGCRPRIVSVWGSDVFDFPEKSFLHAAIVRWVLGHADAVASTSIAMADQVRRLMHQEWQGSIAITPFGVDTGRFHPAPRNIGESRGPLVIGTVKTLEPKYGIDTLIRAFALLITDTRLAQSIPQGIRLRIVGSGSQRKQLEGLASSLDVREFTEFVGPVPHADVPNWLHSLDIYVAASRLESESFGVAVIEASACGLPVVVTRVGGLPEVVVEGQTGLLVERDDPVALCQALKSLALDAERRQLLGRQGRERVQRNYEWSKCVQDMIATYRETLERGSAKTEISG